METYTSQSVMRIYEVIIPVKIKEFMRASRGHVLKDYMEVAEVSSYITGTAIALIIQYCILSPLPVYIFSAYYILPTVIAVYVYV